MDRPKETIGNTYISLFGQFITANNRTLPCFYIPYDNSLPGGWITSIKALSTNYTSEDNEYKVLDLLSESEFQSLFGRRKLRKEHQFLLKHYEDYSITQNAAISLFKDDVVAYATHRLPEWARMLKALREEYSPIENYDRYEDTTITDDGSDSHTTTYTGSEIVTKSGTETSSKTGSEINTKDGSEISTPSGSTTVTDQNNYNGFNASSSVPVSDGTSTTTYTDRADTYSFEDRADTLTFDDRADTHSFEDREDTISGTSGNERTIEGHIHGNIGVMTAMQAIEEELALRQRDLVTTIYREIANHFLLAIY